MSAVATRKRAYMPASEDGDKYLQESDPERWIEHHIAKAEAAGDAHAVRVLVDPALAERLLARNPKHWNRSVSRMSVERWSQTMRRLEWKLNGETIIVALTGELNDGQHRLEACIATGQSFPTFIVFGVERDTRDTLDQGKRRTLRDTLEMHGYSNSAQLSSAASCLLGYLKKDVNLLSHKGGHSPKQILTVLEDHPKLADSMTIGQRMGKAYRASPPIFCALHYLCSQRSAIGAEEFFNAILFNIGLDRAGDPRNRLIGRLRDHATRAHTMNRAEIVAIVIKAWNLWQRGEDVTRLGWRQMGANEDLPAFNEWTAEDEETLQRRMKR